MRHFYLQELPQDIKEIIMSPDDPLICNQEGIEDESRLQDIIPDLINEMCKQGKVVVFESHGVVILLTRKTAWLGNFDTKVGKAGARQIVKAYKDFGVWAKEHTKYMKLESRTPLERYAKIMAKAVGGVIEATHEKSYKTKDGQMIDEYVVGFVLGGALCQ